MSVCKTRDASDDALAAGGPRRASHRFADVDRGCPQGHVPVVVHADLEHVPVDLSDGH